MQVVQGDSAGQDRPRGHWDRRFEVPTGPRKSAHSQSSETSPHGHILPDSRHYRRTHVHPRFCTRCVPVCPMSTILEVPPTRSRNVCHLPRTLRVPVAHVTMQQRSGVPRARRGHHQGAQPARVAKNARACMHAAPAPLSDSCSHAWAYTDAQLWTAAHCCHLEMRLTPARQPSHASQLRYCALHPRLRQAVSSSSVFLLEFVYDVTLHPWRRGECEADT